MNDIFAFSFILAFRLTCFRSSIYTHINRTSCGCYLSFNIFIVFSNCLEIVFVSTKSKLCVTIELKKKINKMPTCCQFSWTSTRSCLFSMFSTALFLPSQTFFHWLFKCCTKNTFLPQQLWVVGFWKACIKVINWKNWNWVELRIEISVFLFIIITLNQI